MLEIVGTIVLFIAVLVGGCVWEGASCKSRWEGSHYQSKFSPLGKCQVSKDGGKTWIPEKNYREFE